MAKLSLLPRPMAKLARGLADVGSRVTVLPATDLFLMGATRTTACAAAWRMQTSSWSTASTAVSTNNVLNPATPYGDCSLIRMANLYANVLQIDPGAAPRSSTCSPGARRSC